MGDGNWNADLCSFVCYSLYVVCVASLSLPRDPNFIPSDEQD